MIDRLKELVNSDISADVDNLITRVKSLDYHNAKTETLFTSIWDLLQKSKGNGKDTGTGSINNILHGLQDELFTLSVANDRIGRYQLYLSLVNKLPEVAQALQIYVDDILSPDSTLKTSLKISNTNNEVDVTVEKLKAVLTEFKLEELIYPVVQNTLLFGDYFVSLELINVNKELKLMTDSKVKFFTESYEVDANNNINMSTYVLTENKADIGNLLTEDSILVDRKKGQLITPQTLTESVQKLIESDDDSKSLTIVKLSQINPWSVIPIDYRGILLGYLVFSETGDPEQQLLGRANIVTKTLSYSSTSSTQQQHQIDELVSTFVDQLKQAMPQLSNALKDNESLRLDLATLFYKRSKTKKDGESYVEQQVAFYPPDKLEHFKVPSIDSKVYGASVFAPVALLGKYIISAQYALIMYRLIRSPEHRIFKINAGANKEDTSNYIQSIIRVTKQKETALRDINNIDTIFAEMGMFEDYYIPVINGEPSLEIEQTNPGGLQNQVDDVELLMKSLIRGLGIPYSKLAGSSDDITDTLKYSLTSQDLQWAKRVVKLQKVFSASLNSLIRKLWKLIYGEAEIAQLEKVPVNFYPPISLQFQNTNEILENVTNVIEKITSLLPTVDKTELTITMLNRYLPMQEIQDILTKPTKPNQAEENQSENSEFGLGTGEEENNAEPNATNSTTGTKPETTPTASTGTKAETTPTASTGGTNSLEDFLGGT